ncbi:terpene synthase family protein [Nocardia terpenica]|uniref:Terpene synthase n=1 Tax=Nocardia terpenica TaxID=455432 RepID=A0A6G9ZDJ9_9NOCA|nr:hypothetical protein [Nocardia terpenica]QIS23582.1 hypothetical protein F6W96_40245 [Nocardia terpenica]
MTVEARIQVPPLYCPIEEAIHPDADAVEQASIAWMSRFPAFTDGGMMRQWVKTPAADFSARNAPDAPYEAAQLHADFTYFTMMFDDLRADTAPWNTHVEKFLPLACRLVQVLETPRAPVPTNDPVVVPLREIAQRATKLATPSQWRRVIEEMRSWFLSIGWQISNEGSRCVLNLEEYLAMRHGTIGGPLYFTFYKIGNGPPVPDPELDRPAVIALADMVNAVCLLINDLYSYAKEQEMQQSRQSTVSSLMHQHGIGAEEAFAATAAIHDRVMVRFIQLRDAIASHCSPEVGSYLAHLSHIARGNLDWSMRVPRYRGDHPDLRPETLSALVSDRPCDTTPGPLPIAAWQWWWDDLDSPVGAGGGERRGSVLILTTEPFGSRVSGLRGLSEPNLFGVSFDLQCSGPLDSRGHVSPWRGKGSAYAYPGSVSRRNRIWSSMPLLARSTPCRFAPGRRMTGRVG